jgi:hypothetical protein
MSALWHTPQLSALDRKRPLTLCVRMKLNFRPDGWAETDAKRRVVSDARRLRRYFGRSWYEFRVSVGRFSQTRGRKPRSSQENLRSPEMAGVGWDLIGAPDRIRSCSLRLTSNPLILRHYSGRKSCRDKGLALLQGIRRKWCFQ